MGREKSLSSVQSSLGNVVDLKPALEQRGRVFEVSKMDKKENRLKEEFARLGATVAQGFDPDVRLAHVIALTSESRATIYRKLAKGEFPIPMKRGRAIFWRLSQITEYRLGK